MYWLRRLFHKQQTEKQLDSELRFHLEQRAAELVAAGIAPSEARRHAQLEFGGTEAIKEECRESRRIHLIETFLQDVRYGLRMLRRNPGFTAIAIFTLTLGIGANTVIFSVVNGVLLNPLPYPHPDQLITLHENKANFKYGSISYPNFRDWQRQNSTFSSMAIARGSTFTHTGIGDAEQVNGQLISSDFFSLLAVKPVLGRTLNAGEDEIGAEPLVLLSEQFWRRKFGSAQDVLGRSMALDGRSYTIIGVIPAGFDLGTANFQGTDIYVPIGQWSNPLLTNRAAGLGIHGIGRLKPGVTLDQAQADMDHVSANLAAAYPDVNKGISAGLIPLKRLVVGEIQPFLVVLLAAVVFVLLIACVNVANLLLARSTSRRREFAIRIALGAGHSRVMRQLLTESILLAAGGGALGLALAAWGTRAMLRALPAALPRAGEIGIDTRVLLFTVVVSLLSGILFGSIPALSISRPGVASRMKEGDRHTGRTHNRAQNTFVVVEIAMALVLLVGAGLMIRSLARLWSIDPGFNPHSVLTFGISLPPSMTKASPDSVRAAFREIDSTLASVPGVQAESTTWGAVPMQGDDEELFWMDGQPRPSSPHDMNWAVNYVVGPAYLNTMGIALLRGRFFEPGDNEHAPLVAVVDESFARKFFPSQDPIGKRINLDGRENNVLTMQIVGIVKHVKQWSLDSDEKGLQAQLYRPFMQLPDRAMALSASGAGIVMRSRGATSGLFDSIRNVLHQINREQVVFGPQTMDEAISSSLAARRYSMFLLSGFAVLALILASIGIYGVVSYVVNERTQEIGIRMALGASRGNVLRLILGQGARMAIFGVVAGLALSLALARLLAGLLYGIKPADPVTFVVVAILLCGIALLACYPPARRATRVDPTVALKCD